MMPKASLRRKLTLGLGALMLLSAGTGLIGDLSIGKLGDFADDAEAARVKQELVLHMRIALDRQTVGARDLLLGGKSVQELEDGKLEYQQSADRLVPLMKTDAGRKLSSDLIEAATQWQDLIDREVRLRDANRASEAIALAFGAEAHQSREALNSALAAIWESQEDSNRVDLNQLRSSADQARLTLLFLVAAGLILAGGLIPWARSALARGSSPLVSVMQEIADHNLSAPDLAVAPSGELDPAAVALNRMKNSLRERIQSIVRAADRLVSASERISASAAQRAKAGEARKAQALQMVVAMQAMCSDAQDLANHSSRAAEASRHAAASAREGEEVVEDSLARMRAIAATIGATAQKALGLSKSPDQIGRVIGLIDDLADRANLMALNADIEAARTGESGRGLAVVSAEVRQLAERITSITGEVQQLVESVQGETRTAVAAMQAGTQKLEQEVQASSQTGNALKQIATQSELLREMTTHIAGAASGQSSATQRMNQNLEQINTLFKESELGTQQAAKACLELSDLALDLDKTVRNFKLDRDRKAAVPSRPENPTPAEKSPGRAHAVGVH